MIEFKDSLQFYAVIQETLAKHPEWLDTALAGIASGMRDALTKVQEQRGAYDLAFRSALSLSDPKRLTAETRKILNDAIVKAIPDTGASLCEKAALERIRENEKGR